MSPNQRVNLTARTFVALTRQVQVAQQVTLNVRALKYGNEESYSPNIS